VEASPLQGLRTNKKSRLILGSEHPGLRKHGGYNPPHLRCEERRSRSCDGPIGLSLGLLASPFAAIEARSGTLSLAPKVRRNAAPGFLTRVGWTRLRCFCLLLFIRAEGATDGRAAYANRSSCVEASPLQGLRTNKKSRLILGSEHPGLRKHGGLSGSQGQFPTPSSHGTGLVVLTSGSSGRRGSS
jgi:hypothetical protein